MSRRGALASALDRAGLLDRLLWARARLGLGGLAVLAYHRVGRASASPGFDDGVIDVEPGELEVHLGVVRSQCTVVTIGDLLCFTAKRPLPPNPVLITFDDGYADSHRVALPLLRRAGVPATFFIPTSFPEGGRLFWWDRISLTMHRTTAERVELAYPERLSLSPRRDPRAASNEVLRAVKRAQRLELGRFWEELERATGVVLRPEEERRLAAREIMSWSQVRDLDASGMDVESHSHRHIVLNGMGPVAAEQDLVESAGVLREQLGRSARAVSYPVGYALRGAMRRAPIGAGFTLGFTNNSGLCDLGRFDPYEIPRLSMEPGRMAAAYKLLLLIGDGTSAASSVWRSGNPGAPLRAPAVPAGRREECL